MPLPYYYPYGTSSMEVLLPESRPQPNLAYPVDSKEPVAEGLRPPQRTLAPRFVYLPTHLREGSHVAGGSGRDPDVHAAARQITIPRESSVPTDVHSETPSDLHEYTFRGEWMSRAMRRFSPA